MATPDWAALERQAVEQLPKLRARLDEPMSARERLGLSFRIALLESVLSR